MFAYVTIVVSDYFDKVALDFAFAGSTEHVLAHKSYYLQAVFMKLFFDGLLVVSQKTPKSLVHLLSLECFVMQESSFTSDQILE